MIAIFGKNVNCFPWIFILLWLKLLLFAPRPIKKLPLPWQPYHRTSTKTSSLVFVVSCVQTQMRLPDIHSLLLYAINGHKDIFVKAVRFFFCIFQSHASASRRFQYSRKRQFLRIRRSSAYSLIMPMLKTAAQAAVCRCFVELLKTKKEKGCPAPFPSLFTARYTAPQKRGKTVSPVEKLPWKFSVLHKVIPYTPAVPLA